jgi:hypothetical protein
MIQRVRFQAQNTSRSPIIGSIIGRTGERNLRPKAQLPESIENGTIFQTRKFDFGLLQGKSAGIILVITLT